MFITLFNYIIIYLHTRKEIKKFTPKLKIQENKKRNRFENHRNTATTYRPCQINSSHTAIKHAPLPRSLHIKQTFAFKRISFYKWQNFIVLSNTLVFSISFINPLTIFTKFLKYFINFLIIQNLIYSDLILVIDSLSFDERKIPETEMISISRLE